MQIDKHEYALNKILVNIHKLLVLLNMSQCLNHVSCLLGSPFSFNSHHPSIFLFPLFCSPSCFLCVLGVFPRSMLCQCLGVMFIYMLGVPYILIPLLYPTATYITCMHASTFTYAPIWHHKRAMIYLHFHTFHFDTPWVSAIIQELLQLSTYSITVAKHFSQSLEIMEWKYLIKILVSSAFLKF